MTGEVALYARPRVSLEKPRRSCIACDREVAHFSRSWAGFDPPPGWRVMKSATIRGSLGAWVKAVFIALASAAIASGTAQAGCSHYVQSGSPPSPIEIDLAVLGFTAVSRETIAQSLPRPERQVPCTGALCSKHPAPTSTATLLDLQRLGNWAILSTSTKPAVAERASSPHDGQLLLPMAGGTSIYHPPRLSWSLLAL